MLVCFFLLLLVLLLRNLHINVALDVVLTTYETLRADLAHVQDGHRGREFRSKRRYPPLPTPLTHIHWHRIVLDECQLVEGHTAAAEMARQLTATYRWAVSGCA